MTVRAKIHTAHCASYSDPIKVEKGELLQLDGREDVWEGHRWLWAVAPDGKAGWIPDSLLDENTSDPVALFNYSAMELTCNVSDCVQIINETHGWAWCKNQTGSQGWVPLKCFGQRN